MPSVRARTSLALLVAAAIGVSTTSLVAAQDPDWDQVENIKEAAQRLADMQRREGAAKTFTFIDACYRTHSLSSNYTRAFEACIAQDYLETQVLSLVYSRVDPEALKRMGAPTPDMLAHTMARRVGAAFAKYGVSKERIATFKRNVDEHGFPLVMATLFPDAKPPVPGPGGPPAGDTTPLPENSPSPGTAPADKQVPGANETPEKK